MDINVRSLLTSLGLVGVVSLTALPPASGEDPYAPQPQSSLQQMLSIDWHKGPDLPQGLQDSGVGIVDGTLITAGGFCQGQYNVPGKQDKYPRGFLQKTWGLNLQSPQSGWQSLPDFPGVARQGFDYAAVNNQLYCWGGFNYDDPYTYQDGYRLSKQQGAWQWTAAPALPHPLLSSGVCTLGSKIYVFGGSDYNAVSTPTYSCSTDGLGARLYSLDTANLSAGWQELAQCPGTPRFTPAMTAVGGKLYVFGGASGDDNPGGKVATIVDNWAYDPGTGEWERLLDLPVASGNFVAGKISAFDRYIILVGGYQYGHVLSPDGSIESVYGIVSKHDPGYNYNSDMWVYDTQLRKFGTATLLPLNTNTPLTVVEGNQIYMIGGETAGASGFSGTYVEGVAFGHHPDLFLTGTISVVPEPGAFSLLAVGVFVGMFVRLRRRWQ
jgi:N-acetylneuraminic acid mutarotase